MSKVSVIIPCYNGEKFINSSIESVYIQDYSCVELIVLDDGSTDNSKVNILSWEDKFNQKGWELKYVYQKNRGLGGAIDTGLKYVTGEYLTLLDADDYFLQGSFKKRVDFLDNHPDYSGVRSNGYMVKGENKKPFITSEEEKNIVDLFSALISGKTNNWAGTYMVRTNILFEFYTDKNIYPSRYGQNMQILLPVAYKRKFGYIDEPLMAYVIHEDSHSQASTQEEQYQKDEKNQKGYREIYIHMIESIIMNIDEKQYYRNMFDASYYRCALLRADKYNMTEQLDESYKNLLVTGYATLNDKITYYNKKNSIVAFSMKIIRKIKSIIARV